MAYNTVLLFYKAEPNISLSSLIPTDSHSNTKMLRVQFLPIPLPVKKTKNIPSKSSNFFYIPMPNKTVEMASLVVHVILLNHLSKLVSLSLEVEE